MGALSGRADAPELVCAIPASLDLTFLGLEASPEPGREQFARAFLRSPGGGALHALAAARLGVRTAAAFPLGDDEAGRVVRAALADAGAAVVGVPAPRTAVTVVMPIQGERALVTYDPDGAWDWDAIAALQPARVLCALSQRKLVPAAARAFVSASDRHLERYAADGLAGEPPIDTLLVNRAEASTLSGMADAEAAAQKLAAWADTVVVTLGGGGALACSGGVVVRAPGVAVDAIDTTGAGDLFAGAWIWGDVLGLDVEERLKWAVLYASLSVTVATGAAGAVTRDALLDAGASRGMRVAAASERSG